MAHAYEIIGLLKKDDVRKKLVETIAKAHGMATAWYESPEKDPYWVLEDDWQDAYYRWVCDIGGWGEIQEILREHVFRRLPRPCPVTVDEVTSLFIDLCGIDTTGCDYEPDFDDVYPVFLAALDNQILQERSSNLFPVCLIPEDSIPPEYVRGLKEGIEASGRRDEREGKADQGEAAETPKEREDSELAGAETEHQDIEEEAKRIREVDDLVVEGPFWERNGIELIFVGRGYSEKGSAEGLYARIQGRISAGVLQEITGEILRIFPSLVRSVAILEPKEGDAGSYRITQQMARLPTASESLLRRRHDFIHTCLDAYYATTSTKKDSFDRRIRNAVNLLAESDAQTNEAVGLALSMAAIEALLGEKGRDLSDRLADNVAVLLEPDLTVRHQAAEFVKKIYDVRSRALHGEQVEGEATVRAEARCLAAAVLVAVISRRVFLSRGGFDRENPADLLKELREGRFQAGQTVGVDEVAYSVRELWKGEA
ncbi:MAG: hypothetical protein WBD63_10010 [Phycisphaerae bacterium]|nr:hypothetical protein [Phycisphaerae bacterium]